METAGTMSVAEASRLLGVSKQAVRVGIERGIFRFGVVVPMARKVFIIYRSAFEAETGIKTKGE